MHQKTSISSTFCEYLNLRSICTFRLLYISTGKRVHPLYPRNTCTVRGAYIDPQRRRVRTDLAMWPGCRVPVSLSLSAVRLSGPRTAVRSCTPMPFFKACSVACRHNVAAVMHLGVQRGNLGLGVTLEIGVVLQTLIPDTALNGSTYTPPQNSYASVVSFSFKNSNFGNTMEHPEFPKLGSPVAIRRLVLCLGAQYRSMT